MNRNPVLALAAAAGAALSIGLAPQVATAGKTYNASHSNTVAAHGTVTHRRRHQTARFIGVTGFQMGVQTPVDRNSHGPVGRRRHRPALVGAPAKP
jgi:hypothetical protein